MCIFLFDLNFLLFLLLFLVFLTIIGAKSSGFEPIFAIHVSFVPPLLFGLLDFTSVLHFLLLAPLLDLIHFLQVLLQFLSGVVGILGLLLLFLLLLLVLNILEVLDVLITVYYVLESFSPKLLVLLMLLVGHLGLDDKLGSLLLLGFEISELLSLLL